jgi:hypothetical protein
MRALYQHEKWFVSGESNVLFHSAGRHNICAFVFVLRITLVAKKIFEPRQTHFSKISAHKAWPETSGKTKC